ncbi:hypothetical protein LB504_007824 [Fusarium proliferatum]|nr:hypothetical protein LB504_007824 [Fusarium proliferatum]
MRAVRYVILLATPSSCCFCMEYSILRNLNRIASNITRQSPKRVELDLISQRDHRDSNSYANAICPFSFYDAQILQSSDVG